MLLVAIFCSSASALRLLGRRAAMGSAALALSSPLSASAKKNTADYASGFVESKSLATLKAEALADVYEPFESALRKDAPAMSKVYTADATIIAGTGSKGLITIGSSDIGSYYVSAGLSSNPSISFTKFNAELFDGVTVNVLHTQYTLSYDGGRLSGYRRLVSTPEGWKIDRELFPLENAKAYSLLQPKRDYLGNVVMELSLAAAKRV